MSFQDLLHSKDTHARPRYQPSHQRGCTARQTSQATISTNSTSVLKKAPSPSVTFTNHRLNAFQRRVFNPQDSAEFEKNDDNERELHDSISQSTTSRSDGCQDEDSLPPMSSSGASVSSFESLYAGRKHSDARVQSIRATWEQKSQFSKLSHEMQQFQKIVSDLELLLKRCGESPEAAWKARILVQSTQETDQALLIKLQHYERSFIETKASRRKSAPDQNTAHMACSKLRRDFDRSHNSLVSCLSLYEQRQQAEISQLSAIRHEGPEEPDFFDRSLHQKELELINQKMHQVNNIYEDLAGLVERQQEHIDKLDEKTDYAKANVKSGADHLHCFGDRKEIKEMFMCGAMELPLSGFEFCGDGAHEGTTVDKTISFSDDKPYGIRVTESFRWSMPFETFQEDMKSVRNDIVEVGLGIALKGKECLQCGNAADSSTL